MNILGFVFDFLHFRLVDALDILLVGFLILQLYKLLRGTIAVKIFVGILSLYLLYLLVRAAEMELLSAILGQFIGVGVLAAIILFQQEIRKFLILVGRANLFNRERLSNLLQFNATNEQIDSSSDIQTVVDAAKAMSATKTGALIVFAIGSELKFYADSGDPVDALITKRLLLTIFEKNGPMHDGAVIIADGRIKAARCIMPVSERDELPAHLGLRHRAALGMSEVTDSVIVIVSEETGNISVAHQNELFPGLTPQELQKKLNELLISRRRRKGAGLLGHKRSPSAD